MDIEISNPSHLHHAIKISACLNASAKARRTGITRRSSEYISKKIENGNSVIAFVDKEFAGFCYIEIWDHGRYVAHSGLIVDPKFRGKGLARKIKKRVFELSRKKFPIAKIFGITTGQAVMKINYELGYKPVHFSALTKDPEFWKGCQTCKNYDVLTRTERKLCLCTGMLYQSKKKKIKPTKFLKILFKNKIK